ncbi:MAG: gas vesicle protein K [Deinococcota bacterium]
MTDKPNAPTSSTPLNTTPLNTTNVSDTNTATTADKNANSIGSRADTETLLDAFSDALPNALDLDPDDPEHGLATLVLAVVELLRELLERQAIRRMEHGNLSDAEIERLGDAFYRLKHKVDELKEVFGVTDDDLDLGFLEQYL